MPFCSEEWVIEPSKADGHGQADEQQGRAHAQGNEVPPGKGALGIPGALAVLAEAAQLHRIGNGVDAVQAGQDERQQDVDRVLHPLEEGLLFAQLHAAGLLGLADAVVVALDIGDVAQGNGHRIADLIRDADAVQAGSKLAGVGGRDKEDGHRQGHKIFQADVDHVEQLFRCQVIPPEQVAEHRAGAVQGGPLIGIEQEDEQVVQQQEHQHEGHHKPDFPEFDPAQPEGQQADHQQAQQHPGVVGDHAGKGEQQEERQLGGSGHLMDDALPGEIIQNSLSGHPLSPPGPAQ